MIALAKVRSGIYPTARTDVASLSDRLSCPTHGARDHRGCLGCDTARSWRRTVERGELPQLADPFNFGGE